MHLVTGNAFVRAASIWYDVSRSTIHVVSEQLERSAVVNRERKTVTLLFCASKTVIINFVKRLLD